MPQAVGFGDVGNDTPVLGSQGNADTITLEFLNDNQFAMVLEGGLDHSCDEHSEVLHGDGSLVRVLDDRKGSSNDKD